MGEEHTKEVIKTSETIFDSEHFAAVLASQPAALGHSLIVSKEHATIFEQVPDRIAGKMFVFANKLSIALFENLQAHGTNILVQNGIAAGQTEPYFAINVIPRSESDNLNFTWQPTEAHEEELSTVQLQLQEQTSHMGHFEKEEHHAEVAEKDEHVIESAEDDYLIKQLRRLP